MNTAKQIVNNILMMHYFTTQRTNEVVKYAGIKARIWNGKRDVYAMAKLLTRAISEDKAREVVNQMPFPYIETYSPIEDKSQAFFNQCYTDKKAPDFWLDVLAPIKKGTIHNITQDYEFNFKHN